MVKDFSDPKKLGFMRFIQIMFALNVIMSIAVLCFVTKDQVAFDLSFGIELLNITLDGACFWLIWKRMRAARGIVIGLAAFNIIVGTAMVIAAGEFDIVDRLFSCSWDILLILYFSTSRRVKAVLIRPFNAENNLANKAEDDKLFQPKTWRFWRNLIIYFCIFSIVGHWMEAGYCTLIKFGIIPGIYDPNSGIWRDWFYPFLVYGFGASACILIFYPVKSWLQEKFKGQAIVALILSYLFNAFVCTLIELAMGLMLNQPVNGVYPLWDYSNMFGNFMGQICLQNAVAFGAVATLLTWVLYPLMEKFLGRFSKNGMNMTFIIIVIAFCILFFFYCINVAIPGLQVESTSDGAQSSSVAQIDSSSSSSSSDSESAGFTIEIGGSSSSSSSSAA